ncbi:MAG: DUF4349 domain-containing protein [Theionarchaea archaeon]|nr:DUF4349 domain-containing protein [Theionarchaea archaeon]
MNRGTALPIGVVVISAILIVLMPFLDRGPAEEDYVYVEEEEFAPLEARFGLDKPLVEQWFYAFQQEGEEVTIEQKLIKSSLISLEVDSYQRTFTRIREIITVYNGYMSDSTEKDDDGRKYGYVIVRVPQIYFDDTIEEIKTLGNVEEVKTTVTDVTEEYVDLTARLNNLKKQEERYLEVLTKAVTVKEILDVENQLERIRGEIESYEGKIRYLDDSIDYATIQVNLREPKTEKMEIGLKDAFKRGGQGFFTALRAVIIFLGYAIPVVFICGLIALGGRAVYKRYFEVHK